MAIWIKNEQGGFMTAYTVEHQGEIFILTEKEYGALAEFGVDVADGSASSDVAVRDFLRNLGVPFEEEPAQLSDDQINLNAYYGQGSAHFNERDCGGVLASDGCVYSDADPGL
jgi:hypothetical protein